MTSPMDPEEDNSNLVSSSGSSPGPFSGDPDACVLQVLPSKPTTPDTLSKRRVPLEPFVHQVGGHFPMVCLAKETLCKPLNDREHKFYKTMAKSLIPFVPRFEGTMRVQVHEDDHGYITLTGHPPPNFKAKYSIHHQMLQLRQDKHRSNSSSGSSSRDGDFSLLDDDLDETSTNETGEVFCNPWALKCHRDHLKKLGILTTTSSAQASSSSSPHNVARNATATASSSPFKKPQNYLLLENLVSGYKYPCVLDLKVGARQYADDVSAAKKARKIAKAQNTTSSTLGLRLTGMQVYDQESGGYICHNKYYGRSLNQESFVEVIEEFFKCLEDIDVIGKIGAAIEELITVLNKLDSYRFYTASLLITYDGLNPAAQTSKDFPTYDVRMIDFAHSTHKGLRDEVVHEGPDSGFIQGLKTLLCILEKLQQKHLQLHRDE